MLNVYTVRDVFTADHNREGWVACQKCGHTLCGLSEKDLCVCQVSEITIHCFIVAAKCYEKLHFVILINETSCFWPPYIVFLL